MGSPDTVEVRTLNPGDAEAYRELRLFALEESPAAFLASLETERAFPFERWVERTTPSERSFGLGAFVNRRLVGTVTFYRESEIKARHRGNLVGMYVHPEHRRRGIGGRLVGELISRARALDGVLQIHLWVTSVNQSAKLLYAAHGFETCGREPQSIKVGDAYYDEEEMVLLLRRAGSGEEVWEARDRPYREWQKDGYVASDDPDRLDLDLIHRFLSEDSYWAKGRSREAVENSIRNSNICLGVYDREGAQVAFARVVSDSVVIGWVCDVFVLPEHRGRGLGKWLVKLIVEHPRLRDVKRLLLRTVDAHGLYAQYGFHSLDASDGLWMEQKRIART